MEKGSRRATAILLSLVVITIFLTGCNGSRYGEVIGELKPEHSKYKLHLFYHNEDTPVHEMNEVQAFLHSNQLFLDNITEMQGHTYDKQQSKRLQALDIGTYPMYVLMNQDGLLFKSPYLSEVKAFIKEELDVPGN